MKCIQALTITIVALTTTVLFSVVHSTLNINDRNGINDILNRSLEEEAVRIRKFVHEAIEYALNDLKLDPNGTLKAELPHVQQELEKNIGNLHKCYDASISAHGHKKVNIFKEPIIDVLRHFFDEHQHFMNGTVDERAKRIKNVIRTIDTLAHHVLECLRQLVDKPNYVPTILGLTRFAGLDSDELKRLFESGPKISDRNSSLPRGRLGADDVTEQACDISDVDPSAYAMESWNWTEKGAVRPEVLWQDYYCGCCYAFSAVGAAEGSYFMKHQKLERFSVKAVVDCIDSNGCNGHWQTEAWKMMIDGAGISLEDKAPAYNGKNDTCPTNPKNPVFTTPTGYCISRWLKTDDALKAHLVKYGPVAVIGSLADFGEFSLLKGPWDKQCLPDEKAGGTHAMLAVGWTPDYWIIKNEYADTWGVGGYWLLNKKVARNCWLFFEAGVPFFE